MKKVLALIITLTIILSIAIPVSASAAGRVTGLKQIGSTDYSFSFSWDEYRDANVKGYKAEWSYSPNGSYTEITSNTSRTFFDASYTNAHAGSSYYVRVTPYVNGSWLTSAASEPLQVVTAPDKVGDIKQGKPSEKSLKISWQKSEGADCYDVYKYYSYQNMKKVGTAKGTSFTIKGLSNKKNFDFSYIYVYPVKKSASGYEAQGYANYIFSSNLKMLPKKVSKPKLSYYSQYSKEADFGYEDIKFSSGYQYKVFKANSKKAVKTITDTRYCKNLKNNTAYKAQVRYYTIVNGTKYYGKWSGFKYFVTGVKNMRITGRTRGSITARWGKPNGGKFKYDVYVAASGNTNPKLFKKNVSKTSITVNKYGKSRLKSSTYYYVRVFAKVKAGKKYVKSEIYSYAGTITKY